MTFMSSNSKTDCGAWDKSIEITGFLLKIRLFKVSQFNDQILKS